MTVRRLCPAVYLALWTAAAGAAEAPYTLVKQWGEFGSRPGQFRFPAMIAVDSSSNVYVVDQHNHRVQKFDSAGRFLLEWGKPGSGASQFNYPFGIAVDSRGDVYVGDMDNHRIQKFSSAGEFRKMAGRYGAAPGEFKHPYGLAFDAQDTLYVVDTLNYRIQTFDRDLKPLGAWGSEAQIGVKVYMPHEIAALPEGEVVLSDRQNHRVSIFSANGDLLRRFGRHAEGAEAEGGRFSEPHGVAAAADGTILVCDRYNFRVQAFTPQGAFLYSWAIAGEGDDSQRFPLGITADPAGNVYVTDHYQHRVLKYAPAGKKGTAGSLKTHR